LAFLQALAQDWYRLQKLDAKSPSSSDGPAALGWENISLGQFLEAAHAWAISSPLPQFASWHSFAQLFVAGKIYE
jgi:hypothetical protein